MKTKKKNRPAAAPKTELSVVEGLAVLKDIHKNLDSLNKQMAEIAEKDDMEAYKELQRQFNLVCSQFDYFLGQLPPVKFDDRQGEYFVGHDNASGKEIYRLRVTRTYTGTVDIAADTEAEARLAALKMYGSRAIEMHKVGNQPTVETIGEPVNPLGTI